IRQLVDNLVATAPSPYWVVGHFEGILIAKELATRGNQVHLSIHDDPAQGLARRSRRYWHLQPLLASHTFDALRGAQTVDVVSEGMRQLYLDRYGIDSMVVHRWISDQSDLDVTSPRPPPMSSGCRIGHVGSVYAIDDIRMLAEAIVTVNNNHPGASLIMIAPSQKVSRFLIKHFPQIATLVPPLPEPEVLSILKTCNITFAAYPFSERYTVFRQSSLPTKLSTYLQAGIPILARTPADSTLATFVTSTGTGTVVTERGADTLSSAIHALMNDTIPLSQFISARRQYFGDQNPTRLAAAFVRPHGAS
ncbi:MAG: hypothetical protein ACRDRT_06855, partial [Pseudonocardiaceae bacterium]